MNRRPSSQRGSVVLVGLILTVVLGIVLTSYISLCTQSLKLSQREYQSTRALQLAENGMEEALWALNKYEQNNATGFVDGTLDGATLDWTLNSSTGTATATITGFAAAGDGSVTRKIGIRVLHYRDPTSVSSWSSGTSYVPGNYASISGTVYFCTSANTGHSPVPSTAVEWTNANSYAVNDYVLRGGTLYRCKVAIAPVPGSPGPEPEDPGYWTPFWTTGQVINAEGLITLIDGTVVRRQLYAVTTPARRFFPNALAAVNGGGVTLSNSGGTIDSYDSTTGAYDPFNSSSSAIVAGTTVNIRSATVKGYTATTGNAVLSNPSGLILAPGATTGKDPLRMSINNSILIPTVSIPTSPLPTVIHDWGAPIANSSWVSINSLSSGTYQVDTDLHLGNTGALNITGNVKLIVPGNLYIGDITAINFYRTSGYVAWLNPGSTGIVVGTGVSPRATLEIYVGGFFAIYAAGIENRNSNPKPGDVSIYTATSSICDIRTDTPFYGTIYAPNTNFTIYRDAGVLNANFYGAVVAKNIGLRGGASLHYDLALRNTPFPGPTQLPSYRSLLLWREAANSGETEFYTFTYP